MAFKGRIGNLLHGIQKRHRLRSRREPARFHFLLNGVQHFGYVLQAQAAHLFLDAVPALGRVSLNVVPEKLAHIVDDSLELAESRSIDGSELGGGRLYLLLDLAELLSDRLNLLR